MVHNNNSPRSTSAPATAASVDSTRPRLKELACLWNNGPVLPQSKYELAYTLKVRNHTEFPLPAQELIHSNVWPAADNDTHKDRLELHNSLTKVGNLIEDFNAVLVAEHNQELVSMVFRESGMGQVMADWITFYGVLTGSQGRNKDKNV
ncbi:5a4bbb6a-b374-4c3d-860e-4d7a50a7a4e2 [Sclerotinia trifoliorum]|uniref:5a4bbb6a-b374-4c3d-860e-4d7a50a7a4e2 n=1 Tax=Sclerotinia trifoliorum TaxID=28548 RepID=A0A8H2ZMR8_9HELO|nr:5a4bbb6a-b374-4c3d-860e-4d7a50a7a4e2 [Sclerotinia trifoliorum]